MTTWGEMIGIVLRDAGVSAQGQTPNAQMANDSKTRINFMINQWKRRRWLTYHLIEVSAPLDGSLSYTIGSGATFDTPRPDAINAAFVRQTQQVSSTPVDYPLALIHSREDYSQITLKTMQAGPSYYLFYDSNFPVGNLYPWPLASSQYSLHVIVKGDLALVGNLTDDIVLPPEYEEAIYANAIIRTRAAFGLPLDPVMVGLAKAALETLRTANAQISTMNMPAAVQPVGRGGYNIWSDNFSAFGNR